MKILLLIALLFSSHLGNTQNWSSLNEVLLIPGTTIHSDKSLNKEIETINMTSVGMIFSSDTTNFYGITYSNDNKTVKGYIDKKDASSIYLHVSEKYYLTFITPERWSRYRYSTKLISANSNEISYLKEFISEREYVNPSFQIRDVDCESRPCKIIELYFRDNDPCSTHHTTLIYKFDEDQFEFIDEYTYETTEYGEPTYQIQYPNDPYGEANELIRLKTDYIFNSVTPYELIEKKYTIEKRIRL